MGTVFSPSYPEVYAPLTKCKWIISAPPGNVIQIMWINFKLEQSLNCGYDYVSIFDNNTENGMGGLMGKYCGHKIPPMLLSSSNIVTVIFITDISLNHDGFTFTYTFVPENNGKNLIYKINSHKFLYTFSLWRPLLYKCRND